MKGLDRIINLIKGDPSAQPITMTDEDRVAVGAVQDLLRAHYRNMKPWRYGSYGLSPLHSSLYGIITPSTRKRITEAYGKAGLTAPRPLVVNGSLLKYLKNIGPNGNVSEIYIRLALLGEADDDVGPHKPFTKWMLAISRVAIVEGGGDFAAFNPNTDNQGLSFGIIQWAQRQGRLYDVVSGVEKGSFPVAGMYQTDRLLFRILFGAHDEKMRDHIKKGAKGLDKLGKTLDPDFDLIRNPWMTSFTNAASCKVFQEAQLSVAIAAFQDYNDQMRGAKGYAQSIKSVRGVFFLIDFFNQHGPVRTKSFYKEASAGVTDPAVILKRLRDRSVKHFEDRLKAAKESYEKEKDQKKKKTLLQAMKNRESELKATAERRDWFLNAEYPNGESDFDALQ